MSRKDQVQKILDAVKLLQNIPEKLVDTSDAEIVHDDLKSCCQELEVEINDFYDSMVN